MADGIWGQLVETTNIQGFVGLYLVSSLGIDRLTRAVLFGRRLLQDLRAAGGHTALEGRGQETESAASAERRERWDLLAYYFVSVVLSFVVAWIAQVRVLDLASGGDWGGFLNYLAAALVIAFGGEGLSNLLELGDPGGRAAEAAAPPAPVQLYGEVVLTPVEGSSPASEG